MLAQTRPTPSPADRVVCPGFRPDVAHALLRAASRLFSTPGLTV
jgi:hypothetical protein